MSVSYKESDEIPNLQIKSKSSQHDLHTFIGTLLSEYFEFRG